MSDGEDRAPRNGGLRAELSGFSACVLSYLKLGVRGASPPHLWHGANDRRWPALDTLAAGTPGTDAHAVPALLARRLIVCRGQAKMSAFVSPVAVGVRAISVPANRGIRH